jgi:hypothetical protein
MIDEGMSSADRFQMAIAHLGRLLEWWRWRSDGLDRMAVGRKRSEAARPKATAARMAKAASDPPDWWDDALGRLRSFAQDRKVSAHSVAKKLAPSLATANAE